nr:hypothetical protein [Turkana Sobemo-like virus]
MVSLREQLIAFLQSPMFTAELAEPLQEEIKTPVDAVRDGFLYRLVDGLYMIKLPVPQVWQDRTGLEKICLLAGATWVTWKIYDRRELFGYVRPVVEEIVPGFRTMTNWFTKPKIKPQDHVRGLINMESVRAGSTETPLTPPKFQCQVLEQVQGSRELRVVGCAVRFPNNVMIAPDHVFVDSGPELKKFFKGRNGNNLVPLKTDVIQLDADLAMMVLEERDFADIGISAASVSVIPVTGQNVKIVGGFGKGTTGIIKNDHLAFGKTIYSGTTLPGYSGAAYAAGSQILAIHQAGGLVNAGFSASFVYSLIRAHLNIHYEESADFLQSQFTAGKKIRLRRMGLDEVAVDINGKYSIVGIDAVVKVYGPDWEARGASIPVDKRVDFFDPTPERVLLPESAGSGELISSEQPGVSSISENSQDIDQSQLLTLINAFQNLSKRQQQAFRTSVNSLVKPKKTTPGQAQPEISIV